jgi:hypothetical protein
LKKPGPDADWSEMAKYIEARLRKKYPGKYNKIGDVAEDQYARPLIRLAQGATQENSHPVITIDDELDPALLLARYGQIQKTDGAGRPFQQLHITSDQEEINRRTSVIQGGGIELFRLLNSLTKNPYADDNETFVSFITEPLVDNPVTIVIDQNLGGYGEPFGNMDDDSAVTGTDIIIPLIRRMRELDIKARAIINTSHSVSDIIPLIPEDLMDQGLIAIVQKSGKGIWEKIIDMSS